MNQYF